MFSLKVLLLSLTFCVMNVSALDEIFYSYDFTSWMSESWWYDYHYSYDYDDDYSMSWDVDTNLRFTGDFVINLDTSNLDNVNCLDAHRRSPEGAWVETVTSTEGCQYFLKCDDCANIYAAVDIELDTNQDDKPDYFIFVNWGAESHQHGTAVVSWRGTKVRAETPFTTSYKGNPTGTRDGIDYYDGYLGLDITLEPHDYEYEWMNDDDKGGDYSMAFDYRAMHEF